MGTPPAGAAGTNDFRRLLPAAAGRRRLYALPGFAAALACVLAEAAERRSAIMCRETVWWRCHRRLIADHALLLDCAEPVHLMPPGRMTAHQPPEGVRAAGEQLIYDAVPG
ncbi:DUF488 domain-containing protein [Arthrobacter sp. I2-34]|uniref:DUF488 domain-containing protein n=1 Tax=Arthrobacter hankyongi TaxID=2904801 RepID=A0ABS9L918_9MICC|nr:DUF488 domain-containing protein [Arthrobacter hankyongi]MCG2623177.1 DUF488 domain-containing protein [Arthrobacter hankyongi]